MSIVHIFQRLVQSDNVISRNILALLIIIEVIFTEKLKSDR